MYIYIYIVYLVCMVCGIYSIYSVYSIESEDSLIYAFDGMYSMEKCIFFWSFMI